MKDSSFRPTIESCISNGINCKQHADTFGTANIWYGSGWHASCCRRHFSHSKPLGNCTACVLKHRLIYPFLTLPWHQQEYVFCVRVISVLCHLQRLRNAGALCRCTQLRTAQHGLQPRARRHPFEECVFVFGFDYISRSWNAWFDLKLRRRACFQSHTSWEYRENNLLKVVQVRPIGNSLQISLFIDPTIATAFLMSSPITQFNGFIILK